MQLRPQVLHIGKWDHPSRGGIEAVLTAIAAEYRGPGLLKILCFGDKNGARRFGPRSILISRKATRPIAGQPLSMRYLLFGLHLARRADIVHAHLPNWLAVAIGLLAANQLVVHWHADVVDKGFAYRLLRFLEAMLLRRARRIIVTSTDYLQSSRPLRRFEGKCEVVPIGLESPGPDAATTAPRPASTSTSSTPDDVNCLNVGRLVPYKGHVHLIRAFAALPARYKLTIVGNGPLLLPLRAEIGKFGLESRVRIAADIKDNRQKDEMLRDCDLFVLSSRTRAEAFGIVVLEAMRASKPVIAVRIDGSGVNSLCRHNVNGVLVDAHSADSLARAIREVAESPDGGRDLGRKGREIFESEYTADVMVRRIAAVYQETCAGKKPGDGQRVATFPAAS